MPQNRQPAAYDNHGDFDESEFEEEIEPRRSLGLGRIAAALLLAIVVGAGIAAAMRPDKLAGIVPAAWLKQAGVDTVARAAPFAVGGIVGNHGGRSWPPATAARPSTCRSSAARSGGT
jgi:hypothetical protein